MHNTPPNLGLRLSSIDLMRKEEISQKLIFFVGTFCYNCHLHNIKWLSMTHFNKIWAFIVILNGTLYASVEQAERLFHESLYSDACPLYEKELAMTSDQAPIRLRLASCYLNLEEPEKAIETLISALLFGDQYEKERILLLAYAYRQTKQYDAALKILTNDRHLERGINLYDLNHTVEAKNELQLVSPAEKDDYFLAQLYLARLQLKEHDLTNAQLILDNLKQIPATPLLKLELTYLQGYHSFLQQRYSEAVTYFESVLQTHAQSPLLVDAQYYLARSYLKLGDSPSINLEQRHAILSKAQIILQETVEQDRFFLALADLYLTHHYYFHDQESVAKAKQMLSRQDLVNTEQALLRFPLAATTYAERDHLYEDLLLVHPTFALAWYYKGLNAQKEGYLVEAAESFEKAYTLLKADDLPKALTIRRAQATALYQIGRPETTQQAWMILKDMATHEASAELLYSTALAGSAMQTPPVTEIKTLLSRAYELAPTSEWGELSLKLQGSLDFQAGDTDAADKSFATLIERHPSSPYKNEALFWRAKCAEKRGAEEQMRAWLREIYENDPTSLEAPRAYLSCYTYRDYMQGERKAIKHLQAMPARFPNQPLVMIAYYLIGLDHKKDHINGEQKIQSHQNLIAAIEAFHKAETLYDDLFQKQIFKDDELNYFTQLKHRAHLERAMANAAIAEQSQGAKKQIFLEYAEEVLQQLQGHLTENSPAEVLDETDFHLSEIYLKLGRHKKAEELYDQMFRRYQNDGIQKGYLLSQVWVQKGKLAQAENDYVKALGYFKEADAAGIGLSPDQKLDIWIQQAQCLRELGQYDESMRLLSQVVNDEAISALRVKAMYLRAEVYALQGKPELALKQLEATSKKGGEWGLKAKEKLRE